MEQNHKRMINLLCNDTSILKSALKLPDLWIRTTEYIINESTKEKADLIFQNKYDSFNRNPEDTVCYVVELKSDKVDHAVLGQLKKYVDVLDKKGKTHGHWYKTIGIAISKEFTDSGLELIKQQGYLAFKWFENNNQIKLYQI